MKGRRSGREGSEDQSQLNCYDIIGGDSNGILVILLSLEVVRPAAMERKRENDKRLGWEGKGKAGRKRGTAREEELKLYARSTETAAANHSFGSASLTGSFKDLRLFLELVP